jgi:DNA-binding response OmpR family regulator
MRYLLAQSGWQASDAANLAEGKALLATFNPHALILDLMLPDGNGADLLDYIRAQGLPIQVAVLTGIGDPAALDAVRKLRPDVLFRKPINVKAFLEWLETVRT